MKLIVRRNKALYILMIKTKKNKKNKTNKNKYGGSFNQELDRIIKAEKKVKIAELEVEALKEKKIIALYETIKQARKMIDFLEHNKMLPKSDGPIPKPPSLTRYNNPQTPATPIIRKVERRQSYPSINLSSHRMAKSKR
jgi:hypothetical protein